MHMNPKTLKSLMKKMGWNNVDVAAALKLSVETVRRFLNGKHVNRSTLAAFERMGKEKAS